VGGEDEMSIQGESPLLFCEVNHSPLRRFQAQSACLLPQPQMKTRRAQDKATEVEWRTERAGLAQSACKVVRVQ
jgi:hypothetical protein